MKIRKICLYIFISIFFISNIINVYAGPSGVVGGGSEVPDPNKECFNNCGGDTKWWTKPIAFGYRASIVTSTGEIATNKDGTETHSFDYWSKKGGSGGFDALQNGNIDSLRFTMTYYTQPKPKNLRNSTDGLNIAQSKYKIDYMGEETFVSSRSETTIKNDFNLSPYWTWNYLTSGGNANGGDKGIGNNFARYALFYFNKAMNEEDFAPFAKILRDCGMKGANDHELYVNSKEYFIIIEPLTAIRRYSNTINKDPDYAGVGTTHDLYKMGYLETYNFYVYNNFMYINPTVWNTLDGGPLKTCNTNPNYYNLFSDYLDGNGCAASFTMFIGDMGPKEEECKVTASNKLSAAHSEDDKNKYYQILTGYDSTNNKYAIYEEMYAPYKNTCFPNGVNPDDENYGLNMTDCYQLSYDYVKNVGYNSASEDLCAKPTCKEAINTAVLTFGQPNPPSTTAEATTDFDKAMDYLYNYYPSNKFADNPSSTDLLKYSNYSALRKNPECGVSIPTCHTKASISCENVDVYSVFEISDSTECNVFDGVAYSSNGSIQSNLDRNYNSNIYCRESVSFVFPGKPKDTKAGRLLSWGVTTNANGEYVRKIGETNEFGKMVITRTCQLDDYNKDKDRPKDTQIYTTWANDLKPKITLTYDDKVSKKTGNLKAKLVKFNAGNETIAKEIFDGSYCTKVSTETGAELVSGNRPLNECIKNYTCKNDNCSDAYVGSDKSFTSVATFDIVYNDNLKWYADKTDQYNPKIEDDTSKSESGEIDNQYILMGYGMPTDLFSGSCNYNKIGINASGEEDRSAGELSVSIENIGSKTDIINPEKYHFDGLLHMNLIYDENGKLVNGITDDKNKIFTAKDKENGDTPKTNIESNRTLYYNCPFKIQNNIFGYEDGKIGDSIICNDEAKGLDVVFRTVRLMDNASDTELAKAFPGRVGDGRYIGSNWKDKNYNILYSILTSDIYEKEEPLYHIELTPSKIKAIRENNYKMKNSYNVDPYTNMDSIKTENGLEEPTYIFSIINDWENIKKLYDFDGDGKVDPIDASSMLYCSNKEKHNDDPDFENYCSKYNGADANGALAAYSEASSGKLNDGIGIHSTSYYLDTLKDNYGLDGICIQYSASERAERYSNTNGCNYPGRLTVYSALDPHDLNGDGVVNSEDAHEAMSQGDEELGKTILDETVNNGASDIQFTSDFNS